MESFAAEAAFMANSAGQAFVLLMEPHRLGFLALGCVMGLVLGIVPGIGGLAGTAMLLPFTYAMDPYSRLCAAAWPRRDHRDRRSHSCRAVRRARGRRLGGDRARRPPDGKARRGRTGAERGLHVLAARRHFRRHSVGHHDSDPAADHALSRLARASGFCRAWAYPWSPSCRATRRCAD